MFTLLHHVILKFVFNCIIAFGKYFWKKTMIVKFFYVSHFKIKRLNIENFPCKNKF